MTQSPGAHAFRMCQKTQPSRQTIYPDNIFHVKIHTKIHVKQNTKFIRKVGSVVLIFPFAASSDRVGAQIGKAISSAD